MKKHSLPSLSIIVTVVLPWVPITIWASVRVRITSNFSEASTKLSLVTGIVKDFSKGPFGWNSTVPVVVVKSAVLAVPGMVE